MPKRRSFITRRSLLTLYPNAAAAYSTRLLNTAYTGPAVRVRRSNDNAEADIGFSGGNLDEAALTTFVGTNSAFVTTWYDQSGNARNATQTTAANQPRIVNAGVVDKVNGRVSPSWQANKYAVLTAAISITQNTVSVFDAARIDVITNPAGTNPRIVGLSNAANKDDAADAFIPHLYRPQVTNHAAFKSGFSNGVAYTLGVLQQVTSILNGSAHSIYRNNSAPSLTTLNATALAVTNLNIGNKPTNSPIDNDIYDGFISEVILYPSDQSANRAAIEQNIMSYFGITA